MGQVHLSDCDALDSIYLAHQYAATPHDAVVDALNVGGEMCFSVADVGSRNSMRLLSLKSGLLAMYFGESRKVR